MFSRRVFTKSVTSLAAAGVFAQLFASAAGAREVSADTALLEELPEEDQGEEELPDDVEDGEEEEPEEGSEEGEDSGNRYGQRKDEFVPAGELTPEQAQQLEAHDNGNHNGLLKDREDDKLRGVGFWANLGKKSNPKTKKKTK